MFILKDLDKLLILYKASIILQKRGRNLENFVLNNIMENGMVILEETESKILEWNIKIAKHKSMYEKLDMQSEHLKEVIDDIENYMLRLLDYELEGKSIILANSRMDAYMTELKSIYKVEW